MFFHLLSCLYSRD